MSQNPVQPKLAYNLSWHTVCKDEYLIISLFNNALLNVYYPIQK
jgi:hypothetical protein